MSTTTVTIIDDQFDTTGLDHFGDHFPTRTTVTVEDDVGSIITETKYTPNCKMSDNAYFEFVDIIHADGTHESKMITVKHCEFKEIRFVRYNDHRGSDLGGWAGVAITNKYDIFHYSGEGLGGVFEFLEGLGVHSYHRFM
jgi:hypothetical protein